MTKDELRDYLLHQLRSGKERTCEELIAAAYRDRRAVVEKSQINDALSEVRGAKRDRISVYGTRIPTWRLVRRVSA